jgi:adenine phosphoribosyltransferase
MNLLNYIPVVEDFPKPGVGFRDVSPLLAHPEARDEAIRQMAALSSAQDFTAIAGIESRGFLFGLALAQHLRKPFVMVRKANKLPPETHRVSYELEYGSDHLEIRKAVLGRSDRVLLVDDVLATGGTLLASRDLVAMTGATAVGAVALLEIGFLKGAQRLAEQGFSCKAVLVV